MFGAHSATAQGRPSLKDVMSEASVRGFNSNFWWHSNVKIPDWFPEANRLWLRADHYAGKGSLTASEQATYSWILPYTTLLTGDLKTLTQGRLIFAMICLQYWSRASCASSDTAVCPLKKKDFCRLSAGSWFLSERPRDSSIAWDIRYFWLWGLKEFWEFTT